MYRNHKLTYYEFYINRHDRTLEKFKEGKHLYLFYNVICECNEIKHTGIPATYETVFELVLKEREFLIMHS